MQTKLIVQCDKCKHQYKVSEKRIGEKFTCFCGNLLTVPSVKIHDAAVVRCSSCGGARDKDSQSFCGYCGSSFTIHERDLDTICHNCMSRISSKSKFCHCCGTTIVADSDEFSQTDMDCPVCDEQKLQARKMKGGDFSLMECHHCAGIWLGSSTFAHLEKKAKLESVSGVISEPIQIEIIKENSNPHKFYRKCPQCEIVMQRRNYAAKSGVVIDICKKHGIWFDIKELDDILKFIRSGQLQKTQEKSARLAKRAIKRKSSTSIPVSSHSSSSNRGIHTGVDVFSEIIGWLLH